MAIAAGKFHGVIITLTPTGWSTVMILFVPRRSEANLASDPGCLLGEPSEELGGVTDLAESVGECLPVLEDDELGQIVLSLAHRLEGPAQDLGAPRGGVADQGPNASGRIYRIPRMAGFGQADVDQYVLGGRVDDRELTSARGPGTTDVETGLTSLLSSSRIAPLTINSIGTVRRSVVPPFHDTPTRW